MQALHADGIRAVKKRPVRFPQGVYELRCLRIATVRNVAPDFIQIDVAELQSQEACHFRLLNMFDSAFKTYAIMAMALVISPGASMAVVTEVALQRGRIAALLTVVGINIANSSLALASMLGLSALFHQWPAVLRVVNVAGAIYLTCLGIRALWPQPQSSKPARDTRAIETTARASSAVGRGIMTNLLNPSVVLFYMLLLPQFIREADPFFQRFLLLAATHVSMSLLWLTAFALAVGTLSERMARPAVRRTMGMLTGGVLVFLGVRMILK